MDGRYSIAGAIQRSSSGFSYAALLGTRRISFACLQPPSSPLHRADRACLSALRGGEAASRIEMWTFDYQTARIVHGKAFADHHWCAGKPCAGVLIIGRPLRRPNSLTQASGAGLRIWTRKACLVEPLLFLPSIGATDGRGKIFALQ